MACIEFKKGGMHLTSALDCWCLAQLALLSKFSTFDSAKL